MIRRKNEMVVEEAEHLRGGEGIVHMTKLINVPEELCGKGRAYGQDLHILQAELDFGND